jgi:stage II sporulation protein D
LHVKFDSKYFKEKKKIYINVVNKDKGIRLDSIKRSVSDIEYYGTIEIIKEGKKLIVINDVNVEKYLYSVVPSEMPESFGYEALKVQAICARTYAYTHMNNKFYKKYDAHVDDSISYQVYNNQRYGKETKKAVDDTRGVVLTYNNQLAKVFYYSTSCGYSCGTKDVFGGYSVEYLNSKKQSLSKNGKVNKEKDFKKFILSTGEDCFEKNCEWFRWKIKWDVDKLSSAVNSNLQKVCGVKKSNYIKVYKNNKYRSVLVSNIGRIKSISINKRGQGGVIKEIIIKGTNNRIKVSSQNAIRQILGPKNVAVSKNNNTKVNGMETLPSACFIIEREGKNYVLTGGGFGHGVGMSQWGVFELTKLGKKYNEIIDYYFANVNMQIIGE